MSEAWLTGLADGLAELTGWLTEYTYRLIDLVSLIRFDILPSLPEQFAKGGEDVK
jgi:hypothetical protein